MAPVALSPWSSLQWSVCVLAVSSLLLPILLLVCASCSKRKSREPSDDCKQTTSTEMTTIPAGATEEGAIGKQEGDSAPESRSLPTETQEAQKDNIKKLDNTALRQLPTLPAQEKEPVRRHSSYTSFNVYDVVMDVQNDWQEAGLRASRRRMSDCSNLYEEVHWKDSEEGGGSFPVYAKVNKVKPITSRDLTKADGNKDIPLYAKVQKTGTRAVKSELIM